jgi:hypothetical protein
MTTKDSSMDIHEQVEQLVADWVKHNFLYLKDGDGTRGLHPVVRLDLTERIGALCQSVQAEVFDSSVKLDIKPTTKKKKTSNAAK